MAPRGFLRNAWYQPSGFTLHERTKTRSSTVTIHMPMKRCVPRPARMRRLLLLPRRARNSSEKRLDLMELQNLPRKHGDTEKRKVSLRARQAGHVSR